MFKKTFLIIASLALLPHCDWSGKCCKNCKTEDTDVVELQEPTSEQAEGAEDQE
jgi:hypothetical protein